jgi:hypothetical protein
MARRSLNPFRGLIDWLNEDRRKPTIPTTKNPALINSRARRNTVVVPTIDTTGITRAAEAMRRQGEEMRRQGERMRADSRTAGRSFSTVVSGGRGVSVNSDRNGSHITVNGRTIDVTTDGKITIDGQATDTGSRIPGRWADGVNDHYRMSITPVDAPRVSLPREVANQIETLLIDIEGTNKHTGTRINALRRILSDAISNTDRRTRP